MNRLEKILSKWNFKKITIIYIIALIIAGLGCTITVGVLFRQRLSFAYNYSRLEEYLEKDDTSALQDAIDKTANSSSDVVDILVLDADNKITYSAKNSDFASGSLLLKKAGEDKKYLVSSDHPDAIFQFVKNDEFMLNSILNKDFGKIRDDYDEDSFYDNSFSSKTVYMLSYIGNHKSDSKIYIINSPTSVAGGMTALKVSAAIAMLFACIYWVLIALWMYRDAAKSKLSPIYWGLIGLFTNLIGLIVYMIYKKNSTLCSVCGAAQNAGHLYCSYCGTQLGTRCENCGSKVGPKDSFCHHCGNKIK